MFVILFNRLIILYILAFFISRTHVYAQNTDQYDQISVFLNVKTLPSVEIPSLIKDDSVFLSISDVFEFLKFQYTILPSNQIIKGTLFSINDNFQINKLSNEIDYKNQKTILEEESLVFVDDKLFLKSEYFGKIFKFFCDFNIRELNVWMHSELQFPAVRERLLELKRNEFLRYTTSFLADSVIGKEFKLFSIGTIDWNIDMRQEAKGNPFSRYRAVIGGSLLGGEFRAHLAHIANREFSFRQQYYLWRYVNNKNTVLRQISLGNISTQSVASIYSPVLGIQLTNSLSYQRRSFGSYIYKEYALPNNYVEFYVNNELLEYIKADSNGLIFYEIPLEYGNTNLRISYFNKFGQQIGSSKNLVIPQAFLPVNKIDYNVNAGFLEDGRNSLFAQGRLNYGLASNITIGAGWEYLNTKSSDLNLSFLTMSFKISDNMIFAGEYVANTRFKGNLNYSSKSKLQIELNYQKYQSNQEAVRFNYTEERKIVVSMPYYLWRAAAFTRLSYNQFLVGANAYNNAEFQTVMATNNLSINITSSAYFRTLEDIIVFGNLNMTNRLPYGVRMSSGVNLNIQERKIASLSLGLEKYFGTNLIIRAAYEQRFDVKSDFFRIGFKYDFSFAQFNAGMNYTKKSLNFVQSASGSLIQEGTSKFKKLTRITNIGKGGVLFYAFLDLNGNGKLDKNEKRISGLNVGSHGESSTKELTPDYVVFTNMEPYKYYSFKVDEENFDHIAWKVFKPALSILVEANIIKTIPIPVVPVGEISGMVYVNEESGLKGKSKITLQVFDLESRLVATMESESDGYFSFYGLLPGKYLISPDKVQLNKSNQIAQPAFHNFEIKENREGDLVNKLNFTLKVIQ